MKRITIHKSPGVTDHAAESRLPDSGSPQINVCTVFKSGVDVLISFRIPFDLD